MKFSTSELGLSVRDSPITPAHRSFRPPSWPPPPDWVVSEDVLGHPLSLWIHGTWDFSTWAGKSFKLDFVGDRNGKIRRTLHPANQHVLRMLATWMIWGPRGDKKWRSLKSRFASIRRIVSLCDREGILASDLSRYPKLQARVGKLYSIGKAREVVVTLDRLLRSTDYLGFSLIDQAGISLISKSISDMEKGDSEQTAYIPPRIWSYQVLRLRECLEDFLKNRKQIEACFNFAVDAYAHNFGSLPEALQAKSLGSSNPLPFTDQGSKTPTGELSPVFLGSFEQIAEQYGVADMLRKWVLPQGSSLSIKSLSALSSLIQYVGLAYIANFTLQRIEEVGSLRSDCLIHERDPIFGRIAVIRGETTKTDPDSDARWPTCPSVQLAVDAMGAVAALRMRCAAANPMVNPTQSDQDNPLLFHRAFEPWASSTGVDYSNCPAIQSYLNVIRRFPNLFDPETMKITEADLAHARMFTPNLSKGGKFSIGNVWPLAYHQLRRTGAINMFASGLLSDSSIQSLLKHRVLAQSIYYGRNHTRRRFSEEVEGVTAEAKYQVIAKQLEALITDRYVSPAGPARKQEIVVNLIGDKDFRSLVKSGKKGEVSFRETPLGGCTKRGHCDYGGIEGVARCTGGDGGKACSEAIYDKMKRSSVERQLKGVEERLQAAQSGSPRRRALEAEQQGLRNYLNDIRC